MLIWCPSYHAWYRELGIGSVFYGVMWNKYQVYFKSHLSLFSRADFENLQICKTNLQQGRNCYKHLLIFMVAVGFSRCGRWERALHDNTASTSSTSCQLCSYTTVLSSEGKNRGTFGTVLHRLAVSISCWKKQFFHDSIDLGMCWAEVKINKRMKSNIERVTKLTEHMLFLFLSSAPKCAVTHLNSRC